MEPVTNASYELPAWAHNEVDWAARYASDADRMALAVELSRQNVEHRTGGPFGAAIFERQGGKLVSVGVNLVVPAHDCTLHAEMVAFSLAGRRLESFTLHATGMPEHELFTSCEPCAMCMGAALWSGVRRVSFAAHGADARELGFEEGPVSPEDHRYLAARGVVFEPGPLRAEARAVLALYKEREGVLYNG
ncbi:MAG TPA: nucleoside deaminase [Gemmatimonadales bacterium]|nr:nucleoside deaminase [Gemmatimonadales bacterium]